MVRRTALCWVVFSIAAVLTGCADDPTRPEGAAVIGTVLLRTSNTDETGTTLGSLLVEGVGGLVVYLAAENALVDSVKTDGGFFLFEGVAPGFYEVVTWIVPAGVVSSGVFEIRNEPIYAVVPLPVADPLLLESAVFLRPGSPVPGGDGVEVVPTPGTPVDSLALAIYPNPTDSASTIEYALAVDSAVEVVVEDAGGTSIRDLVSGAQPAGRYSIVWDGRDSTGEKVETGLYIVKLSTETTEGWDLVFRDPVELPGPLPSR